MHANECRKKIADTLNEKHFVETMLLIKNLSVRLNWSKDMTKDTTKDADRLSLDSSVAKMEQAATAVGAEGAEKAVVTGGTSPTTNTTIDIATKTLKLEGNTSEVAATRVEIGASEAAAAVGAAVAGAAVGSGVGSAVAGGAHHQTLSPTQSNGSGQQGNSRERKLRVSFASSVVSRTRRVSFVSSVEQ